jgi:hypothetical protein
MDGTSTSDPLMSWNRNYDLHLKRCQHLSESGILSLREASSLLVVLTRPQDMCPVALLRASRILTPPAGITSHG